MIKFMFECKVPLLFIALSFMYSFLSDFLFYSFPSSRHLLKCFIYIFSFTHFIIKRVCCTV